MKGHIFNLLEEFLIEITDTLTYDDILSQCSFPTHSGFVSTKNYPDEQLNELVSHATAHLGISTQDAHLAFGEWIFPHLLKLVPEEANHCQHPSEFLSLVEQIHKVELKKLYPDAKPPQFYYRGNTEHGKLLYTSQRGMFDLVEGVLKGVATFYNSPLQVSRETINKTECVFLIHFSR